MFGPGTDPIQARTQDFILTKAKTFSPPPSLPSFPPFSIPFSFPTRHPLPGGTPLIQFGGL